MDLSNIKPAAGSVGVKKRLGRGQGTGQGGTSTRGHKGDKARSGAKRKIGFEGGQMPIQRRVPKFGFTNYGRVENVPINLSDLQRVFDKHGVSEFTPEVFHKLGMVQKTSVVKILAKGELTAKVVVKVHKFSAKAQEAIEARGGSVEKI